MRRFEPAEFETIRLVGDQGCGIQFEPVGVEGENLLGVTNFEFLVRVETKMFNARVPVCCALQTLGEFLHETNEFVTGNRQVAHLHIMMGVEIELSMTRGRGPVAVRCRVADSCLDFDRAYQFSKDWFPSGVLEVFFATDRAHMATFVSDGSQLLLDLKRQSA